jgi:hypothetical protein
MSTGVFVYIMFAAMPEKSCPVFADIHKQFFCFHGLGGYSDFTGFANCGKMSFFFLF